MGSNLVGGELFVLNLNRGLILSEKADEFLNTFLSDHQVFFEQAGFLQIAFADHNHGFDVSAGYFDGQSHSTER